MGKLKISLFLIVLFSLMLLSFSGCQKKLSQEEGRKKLVGEYNLIIGTNQKVSRTDFVSSKMVIYDNGTFVQTCVYRDGKSYTSNLNTWEYEEKSGKIYLSSFQDCAGALPSYVNNTGCHLIVEYTDQPIILLSPDLNIFYEKKIIKAGRVKE
jgi:hypothetical protein